MTVSVYAGAWKPPVTKEVDRPEGFDPKSIVVARPHSYESAFQKTIADIKTAIRMAEIDKQYLEQRLADWKPPTEDEKESK